MNNTDKRDDIPTEGSRPASQIGMRSLLEHTSKLKPEPNTPHGLLAKLWRKIFYTVPEFCNNQARLAKIVANEHEQAQLDKGTGEIAAKIKRSSTEAQIYQKIESNAISMKTFIFMINYRL
jgi:hypothetical protein